MASVRVIPATAQVLSAQERNSTQKRVATFYARVSTDEDEQLTSYEAQVDYYTKLIQARPDWDFIPGYTDEGISAVNTKKREGFKQMVKDAKAGKFDLIVTKSVSRFARNTVDSLTAVRQLKEHGVEIWFEKENIFTFDSKGELLITIMSSLAQEESRSISENVTWGQRKRMADGKISLPYKQFLGYKKGEDGLPEIVPEEAEIVRLIYRLFMEGKTYTAIAKYLGDNGILTPSKKPKWQMAVVRSILTNEKYKGHALLQKTYCENFLTKKMVKNEGKIQQFYVEDSHPAIIDPDEFDVVQLEVARRKALGRPMTCNSVFSSRIVCADCGGWYGKKIWGDYVKGKLVHKEVWRCNEKYKRQEKPGKGCKTPHIVEDDIKARFLQAFNELNGNRTGLIEDCRLAQRVLCDTTEIDAELTKLYEEMDVVKELSRKAIFDNARNAMNQAEWSQRHDGYVERSRQITERINELEIVRSERLVKSKIIDKFIRDIEKRPLVITEFDDQLWVAVIDRVVVDGDGAMTFGFKNGVEIKTEK